MHRALHEHLVVWLDGEPDDGALHAAFRLLAEGKELLLLDDLRVSLDERPFSSSSSGRSLDVYGLGHVAIDEPTPGATSARQE